MKIPISWWLYIIKLLGLKADYAMWIMSALKNLKQCFAELWIYIEMYTTA